MMANKIKVFSYDYGSAGNNNGSAQGPACLNVSPYLQHLTDKLAWQENLVSSAQIPNPETAISANKMQALNTVCTLNCDLANKTKQCCQQRQPFLTIGGDHSLAIGSWSGAASAFSEQGPIGLIWIDAHLDSHTPATSDSKNIHGMPLATLLGHGDPSLTHIFGYAPKLKPEYVCVVGARSYESGEINLLEKLGVKIIFMPQVRNMGVSAAIQSAHEHVANNTLAYGISLDVDAIDPQQAPGVGCPEKNGIDKDQLCSALHTLPKEKLLGADIVEFNPNLDIDNKTEKCCGELISSLLTNWIS